MAFGSVDAHLDQVFRYMRFARYFGDGKFRYLKKGVGFTQLLRQSGECGRDAAVQVSRVGVFGDYDGCFVRYFAGEHQMAVVAHLDRKSVV